MHMSLSSPTDWLQSLAGLLIAGLTWRTLLVLREYAGDTRRLAEISLEQASQARLQSEAAFKPILTVTNKHGDVVFKNVGNGPALNVDWDHRESDTQFSRRHLSVLTVNNWESAGPLDHHALSAEQEFVVTYGSISGLRYKTVADFKQTAESEDMIVTLRIFPIDG